MKKPLPRSVQNVSKSFIGYRSAIFQSISGLQLLCMQQDFLSLFRIYSSFTIDSGLFAACFASFSLRGVNKRIKKCPHTSHRSNVVVAGRQRHMIYAVLATTLWDN